MTMRKISIVFMGIIFLSAGSLNSKEPLKDYSFTGGACHTLSPRQQTLEMDLGFMYSLQFNWTRIWISQRAFDRKPEEYINRVVNYVRTCNKYGVSVVPILFNGSFPQLSEKLPVAIWIDYQIYFKLNLLKLQEIPKFAYDLAL